MIDPSVRIMVGENSVRMVPEDAFLALRALARQCKYGGVPDGTHVVSVTVNPLLLKQAEKALQLLGE